MERDTQLIAKIPGPLNAALKAYAAKLSDDFGIPVSVSAAARRLMTEGLERAGFPVAPVDPSTLPKRGRPPKKKPVHALAGRPTAFQQRRAAKRAEKAQAASAEAAKATATKRATKRAK